MPAASQRAVAALLLLSLASPLARACTAGQYYASATPLTCLPCTGVTYCANPAGCADRCVICPTGTGPNANGTTCLSANCIPCPRGSYCGGGTSIQGCPGGTYGASTGLASSGACTTCVAGTFSVGNATNCTLCGPGTFAKDPGGVACAACLAGTYATGSGTVACPGCAAGSYSTGTGMANATACAKCGVGAFSTGAGMPSNASCAACAPGTYGTGTGSPSPSNCTGCAAGTFSTGAGMPSAGTCASCPAGKYQNASGSFACVDCPIATYLISTGGASLGNCTACPLYSETKEPASTRLDQCLCSYGYSFVQLGSPCAICAPGSYKPDIVNGPCTLCAAGKWSPPFVTVRYAENFVCKTAPPNSITTSGATSFTCIAGYYYTPPTTIPISADGYDNCCPICPRNAWSSANASSCQVCANAINASEGVAVTDITGCICKPGFYQPTNTSGCVACPAGSYCGGGAGVMVNVKGCRLGSTSTGGGTGSAGDCVCLPGYYGNASADSCSLCPAGSYCPGDNTGTLQQCPGNTSSPVGSSTVGACACIPGYMPFNATVAAQAVTGVRCVLCLSGFYCLSGAFSQCPNNSISATGSSGITACVCVPGYYNASGGGNTCTRCPLHYYCMGNASRVPCPLNSVTSQEGQINSSACTCARGYYGAPMVGGCAQCAAGTFCEGGLTSSACTPYATSPAGAGYQTDCYCVAGYVGPLGLQCTACQAGTYTTSPGGLSVAAACIGCQAGTYGLVAAAVSSAVCVGCKVGTFSPTVALASAMGCTNCSAGTYSTGTGMPSQADNCTLVPAGRYQPYAGQGAIPLQYLDAVSGRLYFFANRYVMNGSSANASIYCTRTGGCAWALNGTFYYAASLDSAQAAAYITSPRPNFTRPQFYRDCEAGNYTSAPGMADCATCGAGSYTSQAAAAACDLCGAGKFSTGLGMANATACERCMAGSYNTGTGMESSAKCVGCGIGRYSTLQGSAYSANCLNCPSGSYSNLIINPGPCTLCPAGTVGMGFGRVSIADGCMTCSPGSYTTGLGMSSICDNCPMGSFMTGYGMTSSAACIGCVAGTYSTTQGAFSRSSAVCNQCGAGTFSSGVGASAASNCTACAPGTFSVVVGAASIANCQSCTAGSYSGIGATVCDYCAGGNVLVPF